MRALIILSLSLAAPAVAGNNEITVGGASRTLTSTSANALTGDSLGSGRFAYGRDLGVHLAPRLRLLVEGGVVSGSASGTMFQTVTTEISTVGFIAGARAAYAVHRHVTAGARLDLGLAHTGLTLTQDAHSASDGRWGALVDAAVGVDVLAVDQRRFTFGLRLELGYALQHVPALAPRRDGGDDSAIELEMMGASIGHLDLDGPWFGMSVLSQF